MNAFRGKPERVRCQWPHGQWVGMDIDPFRALCRLPAFSVLRRLLRELLRWHALCDEGRLAAHRAVHAAAILSELVPAALSTTSMRDSAARKGDLSMLTKAIVTSAADDFAVDMCAGLTKAGQKELPSKYSL